MSFFGWECRKCLLEVKCELKRIRKTSCSVEAPFGEAATRGLSVLPWRLRLPAWSCGSVATSVCRPLRAPLSASLFKQLVINTSRPLRGAHSKWGSGGILSRRLWSLREAWGRERVHVLTEVAGPPRSCHGRPGTGPGAVRGQAYRCGSGPGAVRGQAYRALVQVRSGDAGAQWRGHRHRLCESLGSGNWIFLARWY